MRYVTAGDYFLLKDDVWHFRIAKMSDPRYEFLCLIHEEVEWFLTQQAGITEPMIAKFDMDHPKLDDPGTDKRAPYHKQHMMAMQVEKLLARLMGVNWKKYDSQFNDLDYPKM